MVRCEVCSGEHALGAMVPGAALTRGEVVMLCEACRSDVSARAAEGPPMPWRSIAWITAAVAMFVTHIMVPWGHFSEGFAMGLALIFACINRPEKKGAALPEAPRRPAIPPEVEQHMSNTKLLEHLRAVSDFPEQDFIQLRPNSKLARRIQSKRAQLVCPNPRMNAVLVAAPRHRMDPGCDCSECQRKVGLCY